MSRSSRAPEASVLRLSRYHCYVGELIASRDDQRLTSQRIASDLGVSEEAVRRDLSFVDFEGRPGAGYPHAELHEALGRFLALSSQHPFVVVGNRALLEGLEIMFPAAEFGLRAVAYFSENPAEAGVRVGDLEVHDLSELDAVVASLGVRIALVATAPALVQDTLTRLKRAGIDGALMLTPVLDTRHPEGMNITHFRIPCTLKALASTPVATTACGCKA